MKILVIVHIFSSAMNQWHRSPYRISLASRCWPTQISSNTVCIHIIIKDVVTPYTHISESSRYILYTIILTFDGICTIS